MSSCEGHSSLLLLKLGASFGEWQREEILSSELSVHQQPFQVSYCVMLLGTKEATHRSGTSQMSPTASQLLSSELKTPCSVIQTAEESYAVAILDLTVHLPEPFSTFPDFLPHCSALSQMHLFPFIFA